jgi:hypothetical protein
MKQILCMPLRQSRDLKRERKGAIMAVLAVGGCVCGANSSERNKGWPSILILIPSLEQRAKREKEAARERGEREGVIMKE